MKIAYCMDYEYLETGGGGRIQILKTKEYIEKLSDYSIYIIHDPAKLTADTDIIHIFNISNIKFVNNFISAAKKINIKICLSTIYWDLSYLILTSFYGDLLGFNFSYGLFRFEQFCSYFSTILFQRPFYNSKQCHDAYKKIVDAVDMLLPNSIEEGKILLDYINADSQVEKKIVPIVNAIDNNINGNLIDDKKLSLPENYILEVGRIEPRKNQYMLVKALYKNKDLPIIFLGRDHNPNSRYSKQLYSISKKRGNVFFFDEIPYEQVSLFYKRALVHVLPSICESPGLVSLEAMANGCKAVVSDKRFTPVDTYFGNNVTKINPLDIKSIKKGIFEEIKKERNMVKISKNIIDNFSWENTARQTIEAYKILYRK